MDEKVFILIVTLYPVELNEVPFSPNSMSSDVGGLLSPFRLLALFTIQTITITNISASNKNTSPTRHLALHEFTRRISPDVTCSVRNRHLSLSLISPCVMTMSTWFLSCGLNSRVEYFRSENVRVMVSSLFSVIKLFTE